MDQESEEHRSYWIIKWWKWTLKLAAWFLRLCGLSFFQLHGWKHKVGSVTQERPQQGWRTHYLTSSPFSELPQLRVLSYPWLRPLPRAVTFMFDLPGTIGFPLLLILTQDDSKGHSFRTAHEVGWGSTWDWITVQPQLLPKPDPSKVQIPNTRLPPSC